MDELEKIIAETLDYALTTIRIKELAQAILSAGWVKMSIHAEPPKRKRIEPLGETVHKHIVEKEYQEALTLMKFKQDELIDAHNEREEL